MIAAGKPAGLGLGLAITERAVRFHGGRVAAFNRAEGGLLVEIHLPLLADSGAAITFPTDSCSPRSLAEPYDNGQVSDHERGRHSPQATPGRFSVPIRRDGVCSSRAFLIHKWMAIHAFGNVLPGQGSRGTRQHVLRR